jgi:hypothetical protein
LENISKKFKEMEKKVDVVELRKEMEDIKS